ncbi:L-aminoadipate-semialdehyde dehydrogenase [Coniophora puteana RWD-64-598 SS2]|uniref:L-aminoadipate-semialdehyde dehydrogenase n=1 Tax=Coniophora puteana (strain RWD-64-598) TaxID=741705 RepID=A0A5M3MVT6_CONPW|nr:L-aminoadipate-semialdehyde dehydrogenase [Coniophora puteana RWD-64-598 SS2]EIW83278.1 L-aminoadipate-semialdehyde dehydrogenase [Coniophora puteana RWD-64-598 SS2]
MAPNTKPIVSVNQLFRERLRQYPDLEILGIPDKSFKYTKYTLAQLDAYASLFAHHLADTRLLVPRAKGDSTTQLTVGILGVSNLDYVVTEFALFRMGYCVLFISPNNSPPAIAHLIKTTKSCAVIAQDGYAPAVEAALTHLDDPSSVKIISQPVSDVYGPGAQKAHPEKIKWDPILDPEEEIRMPVTIIHSSGSTGYPKPIFATNLASVSNSAKNFNMTSLSTLPLYHGHGHCNLHRAIYSAKPVYLFPTGSIPLTSANIIKLLAQASDVEALYGVPYALKLMAETKEGMEVMKSLKLVTFGGSACSDELGDLLVKQGVRLVGHYGLTEMGQLMTSQRDFETDKGWNWVRARGPFAKGNVADYLKFVPVGHDTYELYVLDGWHAKVMTNQPDGSYASRDLFIKHPTIPDAYKFIGRIDDTLVMVNGEKTNPVPMELTLRSSPYIAEAIIFGSGRTQTGALLVPTEAGASLSPTEYLEAITPILARVNAEAPSHSQLAAEALVVLPFGTAIPKADKGSILRPKVYLEFANVIEETYARLEGESDKGGRKMGSVNEAKQVIRELMGKTIEKPIDKLTDDTDLFEFGLDSLQSSRVRNAIQREIDLGGQRLSTNAVFEHPSITKLAKLVVTLSEGKSAEQISTQQIMLELVEKYRHFNVPTQVEDGASNGTTNGTSSRVVVLTGATGSLGAYLLDELLADSTVATVYCLCRAKDDADARRRVIDSLKTRKLSRHIDTAGERIVAFSSDFASDRLGLSREAYEEILRRVTLVLHNAWAVNFNLGISSFENNIRGAVNLMQLALSSSRPIPADFYFASSVSAVASWPGPSAVPEAIMMDPSVAQGMGYAQSKWVTEKLCEIASETTPLDARVLRIGQMVGDTNNGVWNETEAISLIIKCADTIGLLPDLDESVSWLPVDYAAKSILDIISWSHKTSDDLVYHVLHYQLVKWSSILTSLHHSGLKFKIVPRHEWLAALRASPDDEVANPSRKLLVFYENKYGKAEVATRYPLTTDKTREASKSLREAPVADDVLVAKWVQAWRDGGFLR